VSFSIDVREKFVDHRLKLALARMGPVQGESLAGMATIIARRTGVDVRRTNFQKRPQRAARNTFDLS